MVNITIVVGVNLIVFVPFVDCKAATVPTGKVTVSAKLIKKKTINFFSSFSSTNNSLATSFVGVEARARIT